MNYIPLHINANKLYIVAMLKLPAPFRVVTIAIPFLLGALGSACTKGMSLEFSNIRKSPDLGAMESFATQTSFQSKRQPNIYFIFFDTLRPDYTLARQGSIKAFYDKNLTFSVAYGTGTATWYSMFSLFHSNPSFLAYDTVPQIRPNTDDYGSIFFKILHKLGYKIDTYGFEWRCDVEERPSGSSWARFLMTYFGWKSRLMDRCQSDPHYDRTFSDNRDEGTVEELYKKLPSTVTGPSNHFSFLTFYNNHSPYKWGAAKEEASKNVGTREDFSDIRTTTNRYLNSVIASDINFSHLMNLIDTLPGHEDAIVVLFSDHGEMLYEKKRESGHGGVPYKEKVEIVLGFQFPGEPTLRGKKDSSSIASITDIFPTVFDYMGISPQVPVEWVTGQSLISHARTSMLANTSNKESPTRQMVMINQSQKAWIEVEEDDFYHSKSFRLKEITDLDDREVDNFCENKTPDECKQQLLKLFPEALKELYPAL